MLSNIKSHFLLAASCGLFYAGSVLAAPPDYTPQVEIANTEPIPIVVESVETVVEYRFVGITAHEDDGLFAFGGAVGMAALNYACADEFGDGARAATISEAFFRNDGGDTAWVGAGNSPIAFASYSDGRVVAYDTSTGIKVASPDNNEARALEAAYCGHFAFTAFDRSGPVVLGNGRVSVTGCDQTFPAACSAPMAIRVR